MTVTLHHGEALETLRSMPDNSVDSIVTDPPYGLSNTDPAHVAETIIRWAQGDREYVPADKGFMGAEWDAFVPPPAVWDECYRVLKPGGHAAIFAGSRTYDLMTLAVRLANFEIRDNVAWLYGSGFPKSQNVEKKTGDPAHAGLGTALKPAFEPIILARKPIRGTVAANVIEWGTGALNIDATRIEGHVDGPGTTPRSSVGGQRGSMAGAMDRVEYDGSKGRFPANVALDRETAGLLDQQTGILPGGTSHKSTHRHDNVSSWSKPSLDFEGYGDKGGASRFFHVADNLDELDAPFLYCAKAPKRERPSYEDEDGNTVQHPTVKPVSLIEWLVKLITPPDGTVLDLFAGSGTIADAAIPAGFNLIMIEQWAPFIPLIEQRITRATEKKESTIL